MKKNNQIGQGIGALLAPNKSSEDVEQNNILISRITPNPNQPRKVFDEKSLKQLAQSIDEKGLITPITVKASNNKYIIVAGERRFRAHQLLKRKRILAYIIDADSNKDIMYMALIENIQREDLNAIEQAKGYQYLKDNLDSSITEIAKTVGKSRPAVSNSLRLLNLPEEIQNSILKNEINAGQARAILQKKTTQGMILLWRRLLKEKMSVRKVEAAASNDTKWDNQIHQIENKIARTIGTKVTINNNKNTKKGFIKIHFDSKTWDRVIDKLKSIKPDFE
ncbi:MAG: ParB/RepB/Spo0J family partition protein [Gammaproteobacteria bacterium]|nr:ParB/RepB/Spo0J family partition protein [Gammaproteobacteria bacterium]MBL6911913.1 ParB/RepB/Spo0J family partition protein [Candidatus Neomarinimicrobiota bacterium]|tara:strand:- start:1102 stop:1938 length:837 start_codon:yes stop_codon:yes gene_type:complete